MTAATEDANSVSWIFKNKEHGKMSATASLGAVLLWDVDGGLPQVCVCAGLWLWAALVSPSLWVGRLAGVLQRQQKVPIKGSTGSPY